MGPQELERPAQIFTIPSFVKRRNPDAYQPKLVSIGPYHYGKPELEPMQSHKNRAVIHFLERSPRQATKEQYVDALMLVHDRWWESYEQVPELRRWTPDNFIKLMMVDGIFLVKFLNVLQGNPNGNHDYADTDPMFGKRGHSFNYSYVMEDLLLLENQVPYLVLFTLLIVSEELTVEETEKNLSRLILAPAAIKGHHLLDVYMIGTPGGRECQEPVTGEGALPTIIIDKGTIHIFYNMKAYQLVADTSRELISYIHLLNFFILSAVDVNTLRSQGIIVSCLDSDEAITTVMKELTRDTMTENVDDKSAGIIKQVRNFYDQRNFIHHYFIWITTRWRWVLGIAGVVLYVIQSLETWYSIWYIGEKS
ncbi:hypothetical protein MKX01_041110 [Papaver californicum]|nr:hypothetical protein MKX01_041110 [Papaver californicum]